MRIRKLTLLKRFYYNSDDEKYQLKLEILCDKELGKELEYLLIKTLSENDQ